MLIQWLKKKLLNLLKDDIQEICGQYTRIQAEKNRELENGIHFLKEEEDKRAINREKQIEEVKKSIDGMKKDYSGLQKINENHVQRILTLEKNMRSNNERIQTIIRDMELDNPYSLLDYGSFENNFRGSRTLIKERQKIYLPYFQGKENVLDLGCGRGEFLELMKENGIRATGVDLYQPFVDQCKRMGLEAYHQDALEYLKDCGPADGIFLGQVAEHLHVTELIRFCKMAYEKLLSGGCLIIETPNPTCLAIYSNAFYVDPTHTKPVHPVTLCYYLQLSGFRDIEIIYTETSRLPWRIPELESDCFTNLTEFNESMRKVSEQLFGCQDYAVIAIK